MHSSFLPFCSSGRASPECGTEIVLCMLCIFVWLHLRLVCLCANKDNSVLCMGMHPHFVFGMPECQIIPCERAGGSRCLLQSLEGKHESLPVRVLWEQETGYREKDRVGAFKLTPALHPRLILFDHCPHSFSLIFAK